jgi:hypothetical protein
MTLDALMFHLVVICIVIAVVLAAIRKDNPRAIALAAARLFGLTIAVLAGIAAILHILLRIPT